MTRATSNLAIRCCVVDGRSRLLHSRAVIIRSQGAGSRLEAAVGNDATGKISAVVYALAIPLAFVHQLLADSFYVLVALMWLIPARPIEALFKVTTGETGP